MKRIVKYLSFLLLFLAVPKAAFASTYEVTSYEISVALNKNKTATIEENYELYFSNTTKEFNRAIDTSLAVYRKDGSKSIYNGVVDDIVTKNEFSVKNTDKLKQLTIALNGKKNTKNKINLKYNYDFGKDEEKEFDEFYYNLVSNFDSVVSDVAFEIVLPDEIKTNNISFNLNGKYNLTDDDIIYDVEGNIITGYLNIMLQPKDVLGIRIELPEGYFVGANDNFNYLSYLFIILPIITFILVVVYWFKYRFGNNIKRVRSTTPPNNYDPAEIGYIYKGASEENDLVANILELANEGYLQIKENDDGYKLGKENTFEFVKVKDYKGHNAVKKILFKGIFNNRDKASLSDIEFTIGERILTCKKTLDNYKNRNKFFFLGINKSKMIAMIFVVLSTISITITPVKVMTESYWLVPVLSITFLVGLGIIALTNAKVIAKIILGIVFIGGTGYLNIYSLLGQNKLLVTYLIGFVLSVASALIFSTLSIRTKQGNEKLGQVEGFKNALIGTTQDDLKEKLTENKNYFYDMVPYAIVFGIVDLWFNTGKEVITERPIWHITNEEFSMKNENKFVKNFIYTTTQVMIKGIYGKKESSQLEFKRDVINSKLNS